MTGADLQLSLLTIRSIILKCVNIPVGGELYRHNILVLTSLVQLYCDIHNTDTDDDQDMVTAVCSTLEHVKVSPQSWINFICGLSDEIFLHHQDMIVSSYFWSMIQAGLVSEDGLTRKRSVDNITSDKCKLEDKSGLVCPDNSLKSAARDNFEKYFLVLETLEEKQVHLVKQVVSLIEHLLALTTNNSSDKVFHQSWMLILFLRVFQHPNIAIVRWGVQTFLLAKFTPSTISDQHFLSFLCNPLLDVLNDTKIYSKDFEQKSSRPTGEIIAELFAAFLENCLSRLDISAQTTLMRTLLTAISNKSWAPIPLTWISFALVKMSQNPVKYLTNNEVVCVSDLVDKGMQYQEPLLRSAAQVNLCSFVLDHLQLESVSYEQMAHFLFVFWSKKVLFCDLKSQLWSKASAFVSAFFKDEISNIFLETINTFEEARKLKDSTTIALEVKVTKACLLVILFCSHHNFNADITRKIENKLLVRNESNRAYEGDRFNYNDEQWERVELFALQSIFKILKVPERRQGKKFLTYSNNENRIENQVNILNIFCISPDESSKLCC